LTLGRSTAVFGAAILMVFGTTACASKKYVRQTVSPVENRVATTEKKTADNASAISEVENNLSRTDEKATEAGKNAQAAGQAAERANQAAVEARNRADAANSAAEQASSRVGVLANNLNNIDNYQLVTTEAVLFPFGKATLTNDAKQQLDQAVSQIQSNKNYLLEIEGFTDKTGKRDANVALAERRADAVVRYLTVQHQVPLRKIHVLGVGPENFAADNKTRAGRKQNRRVELKVYALNLEGGQSAAMSNQGGTTTGTGTTTGNSSNYATGRSTYNSGNTGNGNSDQVRSRANQGQSNSGQSQSPTTTTTTPQP
jgi:OOP family OmpA-OmpF porin